MEANKFETIAKIDGFYDECSMPIDKLIEILTKKKEQGYNTACLALYGEGALDAECHLEVEVK